ncbi:MAG TPA: HAMP domain-containing sensor histidine kinase [Candidatus Deferrimicrobiaceae bacterium]
MPEARPIDPTEMKPASTRPRLILLVRAGLFLFLLVSSIAVVRVTYLYTNNARRLAESSLESTALALSASAENALRSSGKAAEKDIRAVFADRVVAYALIAGEDGTILFHTNPTLAGSCLPDCRPVDWSRRASKSYGRRVTLGTGLPAYEFDRLLRGPGGRPETLRIVLHTTQADAIVARGNTMRETVAGILALLWASGILLERLSTHYFRIQSAADARERLALIGQMTATLAHEIRNAIGSIKGFAQWADEKTGPGDPRKKGLDAILQGTARIETLVDDLLRFSREESYAVEAVDPAAIAEDATGKAVDGWHGRVELNVAQKAQVLADPEKLHRVLSNALRNALQAMGDEGVLSVSVQPAGRWVFLLVEDTGPGIPASETSRLFTPFFTTKADGTGLGLAYSRKVVEGMGGRIELVNRENGPGARLEVRLPKAT